MPRPRIQAKPESRPLGRQLRRGTGPPEGAVCHPQRRVRSRTSAVNGTRHRAMRRACPLVDSFARASAARALQLPDAPYVAVMRMVAPATTSSIECARAPGELSGRHGMCLKCLHEPDASSVDRGPPPDGLDQPTSLECAIDRGVLPASQGMDRRRRAGRAGAREGGRDRPTDPRPRRRSRQDGSDAPFHQPRLRRHRLHTRARSCLPPRSPGSPHPPGGRARSLEVSRRVVPARRLQLQRHRRGGAGGPHR